MQLSNIVIHHSATVDGGVFDWKAIENYHKSWKCEGVSYSYGDAQKLIKQGKKVDKPWDYIGYHFGVEDVGGRITGLIGRPLNINGAHCTEKNMNSTSIGICIVGNYDLIAPSTAVLGYLVTFLLKPLMEMLKIKKENVYFHREFAPKTCPGKLFLKDSLLKML